MVQSTQGPITQVEDSVEFWASGFGLASPSCCQCWRMNQKREGLSISLSRLTSLTLPKPLQKKLNIFEILLAESDIAQL